MVRPLVPTQSSGPLLDFSIRSIRSVANPIGPSSTEDINGTSSSFEILDTVQDPVH